MRAVEGGQKLKDAVADLLRKGLASDRVGATSGHQVKLPLVDCRHGADLSPDRVAEILTLQEPHWHHGSVGY